MNLTPSTPNPNPAPRANILLVDDRPQNLIALEALLANCDANIYSVRSGNDALAIMLDQEFALVLLDIQMPGMDGFEVAELMRGNDRTRHIPIIFVTAINKDQAHIFKGYESGAVDFLAKPLDPFIVQSKVNVFLNLWQQQQKLQLAMERLQTANEKILAQQSELQAMAMCDHLTGLYQRRWFDEIILKQTAHANRHQSPLALAFIDIDYFKKINDEHGHNTGDAILIQLAELLLNQLREDDTVFRYGGEEFVILMPQTLLADAATVCDRIRSKVADTAMHFDQTDYHISISIGIASLLELPNPSPKALVSVADKLLYQAKAEGRNRICY